LLPPPRLVTFLNVADLDIETELAESAAAGGTDKPRYVQRIFSEIAPRYDLLNHLLSLNIDRTWRRRALRELAWDRYPDGLYLDLCAGTLDVAALLARQVGFAGRVIGADFAEPMLRAGQGKTPVQVVLPVAADALSLPLPDESARGAIVAFGLRNVADLDAALAEVHRVLMPGARFVILDFSTPRAPVVRTLYRAYFHHVLPAIGGAISGQRTAYRYLPRSVAHFPGASELARHMERAGFRRVRWYPLTMEIATVHVGERP
jgi:demethylmenaquinone methyltransferase/2-methoxy-6-polyprenyl-1,4-benzoquinol methylase